MSTPNRVIVLRNNPLPRSPVKKFTQNQRQLPQTGNAYSKSEEETDRVPTSSFVQTESIAVQNRKGETPSRAKGKAAVSTGRRKPPPKPKLTHEMLQGKSGVDRLIQEFKVMKFSKECDWRVQEENLHHLMHKYETWGRQLVPQMSFEQFISSLEKIASKREFRTRVEDVEAGLSFVFDKQVQEELEAGDKMRLLEYEKERQEYEQRELEQQQQQQQQQNQENQNNEDDYTDVVISEPPPRKKTLTDEDRKKIELNKQKAMERRRAKELEKQRILQQQQQQQDDFDRDIELQLELEQENQRK